jgi:methionine-rich copper-binding protein CopC
VTLGRRGSIATVALGLTMIGGTGVAVAASGPVGTSPTTDVVAHAPLAVSVTFAKPLRSGGASMRVLSAVGDVGRGKVTTGSKTLRRELKLGAPAGDYTIQWTAVSASGRKMSGSFSFIAARGNSDSVTILPSTAPSSSASSAASAGSGQQSPPASPSVTLSGAAGSTSGVGEPTDAATVAAVPSGSAGPTTPPSSAPTGAPTPSASADVTPSSDSQPAPSLTVAAVPLSGDQHGPGGTTSSGFTVVPLTVGALLVIAAGLISWRNRPRRQTLRSRTDVYSV